MAKQSAKKNYNNIKKQSCFYGCDKPLKDGDIVEFGIVGDLKYAHESCFQRETGHTFKTKLNV